MAGAIPLVVIVAIPWRNARDFAAVAIVILPILILSQELAVRVLNGRISRKRAAAVRLAVIGLAVMVPYLLRIAL